MNSSRSTQGQAGALPTGFVSRQQAETLCRMLATLSPEQVAQVSGAGPISVHDKVKRLCKVVPLPVVIKPPIKICEIVVPKFPVPPISCFPVAGL